MLHLAAARPMTCADRATVRPVLDLESHAGSYKLAFDEGGRALDAQERAVNELRSRAGVLVAAAAITTSFFGSRALTGGPLTVAGWIAIAAFALVAGIVLAVLWPWRDWAFSATPQNVIATYIETSDPVTLVVIHRDMALHRSASWLSNARLLGRLYWALRAGLALVAAEVAAWVVVLGGQGY
jgi:hypothetical protein